MKRTARLSECGTYRYRLGRHWNDDKPFVLWVMLNPSIADAYTDDATIRKCIGYAQRWGFGGIEVINLFAFRSPDPKVLVQSARVGVDIVGPGNDEHIAMAAVWKRLGLVVAAWGAHAARYTERVDTVLGIVRRYSGLDAECLGRTSSGAPTHPCRLGYDRVLEPWS